MVLGVVFGRLGIAMLITHMFKMAIIALVLFVAIIAGGAACVKDADALVAIVVRFVAGVAALAFAQGAAVGP